MMNVIMMLSAHYPLVLLVRIYDCVRSRIYRHKHNLDTVDPERELLRDEAIRLFEESRHSIGSRSMSILLKQLGYEVGRYKARSLMQEANLVCKQPSKKHCYRHNEPCSNIAPNLLDRRFNPEKANQYWCGDVTYIRTQQGWCYAAVVLELYSRKVIGWAVSDSPDSKLTIAALDMAVQSRGGPQGVTFHSDQGCHYTSKAFVNALYRNGITQSMSRRGNCWDNAVCERLFRSFKSEWMPREGYVDLTTAKNDLIECIVKYYNPIRPHTHNGGLSPNAFERMTA